MVGTLRFAHLTIKIDLGASHMTFKNFKLIWQGARPAGQSLLRARSCPVYCIGHGRCIPLRTLCATE